ncbi:MAG: hypothetical protein SFY81_01180 [Verrucomicrobiota bacterium]|nr:hypothetical protein [Verrucomicrobiota bacterium]
MNFQFPPLPDFRTRHLILLLALLLLLAFPGPMLGYHTFFYRDFGVMGYPTVDYHKNSLWSGELPLWNPYSNCGVPFLAQWGTLVLYPGSLIYLLLPLPWSVNFFCLLHLLLAGVGMFRLARNCTRSTFASIVAALLFLFSGVTLASLQWINYTVAIGWMPWVVLTVRQAWLKGGKALSIAALVCSMQLLAGVPELVFLTALALLPFWIIDLHHKNLRIPALYRPLLIALLVFGLTAAQMLPFLDLLSISQRNPAAATGKWALPAWGWANFLVPLFHTFNTPEGTTFQTGQEFLSSTYIGPITLTLALCTLLWARNFLTVSLALMALFGSVMALGDSGFLYSAIRELIPFIGIARFPVKFLFLSAFLLPLLAGFAVAAWKNSETPASQRNSFIKIATFFSLVMIAILAWQHFKPFPYDRWDETLRNTFARLGILVAFAWLISDFLTRPSAPKSIGILLLLLIALDGRFHLPNQNPVIAPSVFLEPIPAHAPKLGQGRAFITPSAEKALLHSSVKNPMTDMLGKRMAFWSHLNLLGTVPKVNGSATLRLREQVEFQKALYQMPDYAATNLLDFLGVTFITAPGKVVEWATRPASPLISSVTNVQFLPPDSLLATLTNGLDLASTALLEPGEASFPPLAQSTISDVQFTPHVITGSISNTGPALLVIAQSFNANWKAFQDGNSAPLLRVNHAFTGLLLQPGTKNFRFVYEDRSFRWGAIISLITLCFTISHLFPLRRITVPQ